MKDLIKALEIFLKYRPDDDYSPLHCEHDKLHFCSVHPSEVSEEDKEALEKLSVHNDGEVFYSHRFGSC
jgi:hypothetical protein